MHRGLQGYNKKQTEKKYITAMKEYTMLWRDRQSKKSLAENVLVFVTKCHLESYKTECKENAL